MIKLKRLNNLTRKYSGLSGGQVIYQKLLEHDVKNVWLSTGGAVMPLVDAFYKGSIKYYLPTHEQSGGHSAAGYAKSTGKPGISIVTSGPGFTNSLTPLTDAMNDSVPFILLSGQVPLAAMGTQAFQECPSVAMSTPITKWSYCAENTDDLPSVMDEAFRIATSGKPGAVHIDLPKCVLSNELDKINNIFPSKDVGKKIISNKKICSTIDLINNSKKPLIIAGQGCNNSYRKLREFVERSNIPITTTIHAMGSFDETHPLSLQFLGMHGNAAANYAVQDADLIIGLGTRFDDRIIGNLKKFAPKAFEAFNKKKGGILHVNIDNNEIKNIVDSHYNYNLDCNDFFDLINDKLIFKDRKEWIDKISLWKNKYEFNYNEHDKKLKTQQVIDQINTYLLKNKCNNYFISTGVGNHQMMASQFIKWKYPKSFLTSGSLGTMGVGLPYAIGCQIGNPNSLVIDIDGDGSFNHSIHELKSVNDYNLPIKIAIMNDSKLSMVQAWEKLFYGERYTATDLGKNPNYVELAKSFGIKGIKCDNKNDLSNTIDYFLNYKGPILCDFVVEPDLCLPLVAPGSSLDKMILHKNENVSNFIDPKMPPS